MENAPVHTILEAQGIPKDNAVSLYACVEAVHGVKASRNGDPSRPLHLSDPSLPPGETVTCMTFGRADVLAQIPDRNLPVIIHIHKAKTNVWEGRWQLLLRGPDSFAIYSAQDPADGDGSGAETVSSGTRGSGLEPIMVRYPAGNKPKRGLPQPDPARIQALRRWIREQQAPPPQQAPVEVMPGPGEEEVVQEEEEEEKEEEEEQGGPPRRLVKVQDVAPPKGPKGSRGLGRGCLPPVDMIGRVLSVDFTHYPTYFVLHIWDGTDARPLPLSYSSTPPDYKPPEQQQQPKQLRQQQQQLLPPQPLQQAPAPRQQPQQGPQQQPESQQARWRREQLLPHSNLLHMPLSNMARSGARGSAGSGDGDGGRCLVLSAVLGREEMPVAGTGVPVVLPTSLFTLAPPSPTSDAGAAAAGAAGPPAAAAGAPPGCAAGAAGAGARTPARGGGRRGPWLLPRPGDWVKLRNVTPRFVLGQLQLSFSRRSSLVPRTDAQNAEDMKVYQQRLTGAPRGGTPCLNASAPSRLDAMLARAVNRWQALPLRTLRQLLMQQDACDCTPARVLVRVVSVLEPQLPPPADGAAPATAAASTSAAAAAPAAATASGGPGSAGLTREEKQFLELMLARNPLIPGEDNAEETDTRLGRVGKGRVYRVVLLLQDATGTLPVFLAGRALDLFFFHEAPQPRSVRTRAQAKAARQSQVPEPEEPCDQQRVITALRRLTDQSTSSGAWMECVLRPMYLCRGNPWQSPAYLLEHTAVKWPRR